MYNKDTNSFATMSVEEKLNLIHELKYEIDCCANNPHYAEQVTFRMDHLKDFLDYLVNDALILDKKKIRDNIHKRKETSYKVWTYYFALQSNYYESSLDRQVQTDGFATFEEAVDSMNKEKILKHLQENFG